MSANALLRAAFLTLAFPRLIAWGRKVFAQRNATDAPPVDVLPGVECVGDSVPPAQSEGVRYPADQSALEPSATSAEGVHKSLGVNLPERMPAGDKNDLKKHGQHGSAFNLAFLRYSCVLLPFLVRCLLLRLLRCAFVFLARLPHFSYSRIIEHVY
jgi:hypothetical protein